MTEVRNVVGHAIHPDEPLMAAGLDSRGGMELRRTLAESLSMQLPVTLLYDYQSVNAIVEYINMEVGKVAADAAGTRTRSKHSDGSDDDESGYDDNDSSQRAIVASSHRNGGGVGTSHAATVKVSKLFKTLRAPAKHCPLFLAAPGVANAQSAYFSFSMFLQV